MIGKLELRFFTLRISYNYYQATRGGVPAQARGC